MLRLNIQKCEIEKGAQGTLFDSFYKKLLPLSHIKNKKIKIIEDSAEMIGQKFKKKRCGSFGDISTFSFYANKHITTGEGGMILRNDLKTRVSKYLVVTCF